MILLPCLLYASLVALVCCGSDDTHVYIGIVSYDCDKSLYRLIPNPDELYTCVSDSYVQWVQQSGAVAVIIPYDLPTDRLIIALHNLNGVIVAGKNVSFHHATTERYTSVVNHIISYAVSTHETSGVSFPVMGIGSGMYSLALFYSKISPIYQTNEPFYDIHIRKDAECKVLGMILYDHTIYAYNDVYDIDSSIYEYFDVLGEVGEDGKEAVGMMKHKKHEFYGLLYNIDKIQYDDSVYMDRSMQRVEEASDVSSKFVERARLAGREIDATRLLPLLSTSHSFVVFKESRVYVLPYASHKIPSTSYVWTPSQIDVAS